MNFAWQGQSCGSISRLFIHELLYDKFLADLVAQVGKMKIGDPLSDDSKMGPINTKAAVRARSCTTSRPARKTARS